jgi:DNA-binding NarL/FixJ family response regulator
VRVVIADPHPIVRRAVRDSVVRALSFASCIEASDGEEALQLILRERPEMAVLGVMLPKLDGVEVAAHVRTACPGTRVLIFTMRADRKTVAAAVEAGARGFVLKSGSVAELDQAIAAVSTDRRHFAPKLVAAPAKGRARGTGPVSLTRRELEVVQMIAGGCTSPEMARTLGVSLKTIGAHRTSALAKLDVHSGADLVRTAIREGLFSG